MSGCDTLVPDSLGTEIGTVTCREVPASERVTAVKDLDSSCFFPQVVERIRSHKSH